VQERFFSAIHEDMEVCDLAGDKVGKVDTIYRPAGVVASSGSAPGTYAEPSTGGEPYLKVETGVFGLGKDLYIPASAVAEVAGDRVMLSVAKDGLDRRGWDQRPEWIPE